MRTVGGWTCLVMMFLGLSLALDVARADVALQITEPASGSNVSWRPAVKGTTTQPSSETWVVVHPTETSEFWVQPRVSQDTKGNWMTVIYIGRAGPIDVGKHFEIVAFANPAERLWEGLVLGDWPAAEARSQLVEATRK